MKAEVVVTMSPDRYQALKQLEIAAVELGFSMDDRFKNKRVTTDEALQLLRRAAENYSHVREMDIPR